MSKYCPNCGDKYNIVMAFLGETSQGYIYKCIICNIYFNVYTKKEVEDVLIKTDE